MMSIKKSGDLPGNLIENWSFEIHKQLLRLIAQTKDISIYTSMEKNRMGNYNSLYQS